MRYGVESLAQGAAKLAQSLGMGQQMALEAQNKEQLLQNNMAYTGARARKTDTEANILADQLAARGDLGSSMGVLAQQLGLADGSGDALSGLYRASGGKANSLGEMLATLAASARLNQAVSEADPTRANKLLIAGGEEAYTPWSQTAGGLAIDQGTGQQVQTSPAARATIGAVYALAGERSAGARAAEALAGVRNQELANLKAGKKKDGSSPGSTKTGDGDGPASLKAADSNSIYSKAAALFGGIYDPITRQFQGLDSNKAAKAVAIAAEAAKLWTADPSGNHSAAVADAARLFGIEVPGLDIAPAVTPEQPVAEPTAGDTTGFGDTLKKLVGDLVGGDEPATAPAPKIVGGESGTREDPVTVMSPEQAQFLPPGTYFRNPAGKLMRVPLSQ